MKTKEENYESPPCKTIEIEAEQIICGSRDGETAHTKALKKKNMNGKYISDKKLKT